MVTNEKMSRIKHSIIKLRALLLGITLFVMGLVMLILTSSDHPKVSRFDKGENSVMVIDLTNQSSTINYQLVTGILLVVSAIVLLIYSLLNSKGNGYKLHFQLTDKEKEIISLIMKGKSNKDIANELCISLSTVKTHINNLYRKLGVRSRSELRIIISKTGSSTKFHPSL